MDIALICAGALTVLGVVTAVCALISRLLRVIRRLGHLADDLFGEPARDGVPARPGVMQRLHAIERELRPNSGASLRDALDRVERHLTPPNQERTP